MSMTRDRLMGPGVLGLMLAGAFLVAGCGDSGPTGVEGTGSIEAHVEDRGESESPATSDDMAASSHGDYSGTMTARAQVFISVDGQTWTELGQSRPITVQLQSDGQISEVHARTQVPAGTYTRVRLVLNDAQANIAAGSSFGGIGINAAASVRMGSNGEVMIEKSVPAFQVTAGVHTRITWNMNTHLWMDGEKVEEEEADEGEVEDAAEPRVDQEEVM